MNVKSLLLSSLILSGTTLAAFAANLTNADVIKLVKAGLDESLVISSIQNATPAFDTSPEGLIALSDAKVPSSIVKAMIEAGSAKKPSAPSPAKATAKADGDTVSASTADDNELTRAYKAETEATTAISSHGVSMKDGDQEIKLTYNKPETAFRTRALGFGGGASYMSLNGSTAKLRLKGKRPSFFVYLPSDAQPEQCFDLTVWAVRRNGTRELMTMNVGGMGVGAKSGFPADRVIAVDCVPVKEQGNSGQTLYQITPKADLAIGEYAFVIRRSQVYDFGVDH